MKIGFIGPGRTGRPILNRLVANVVFVVVLTAQLLAEASA